MNKQFPPFEFQWSICAVHVGDRQITGYDMHDHQTSQHEIIRVPRIVKASSAFLRHAPPYNIDDLICLGDVWGSAGMPLDSSGEVVGGNQTYTKRVRSCYIMFKDNQTYKNTETNKNIVIGMF